MNKNAWNVLMLLTCSATAFASRMTVRDLVENDTRPVETHVYKSVEGQDLHILSCKPDGWSEGLNRPAMVWIHGGGFTGGDPTQYTPHMKYSAARGAVGFSLQYRLMKSPDYKPNKQWTDEENDRLRMEKAREFIDGPSLPELVDDVADAIRYIRNQADRLGVDPDRISVIGDSAGAYLANALGTLVEEDARANVVIPCSSISDLTVGFGRDSIKPSSIEGIGIELEEDPERLARSKALSPVFNVQNNGTAFLVLAGANDWLGDEPKQFYDALKAKGVDAAFKSYAGARHAFILTGYSATDEQITRALLDIDAFLVEQGFLTGPSLLAMPKDAVCLPFPPLALPGASRGLAFDCHGNFWTLVENVLRVLPAQDQSAWIPDIQSGMPEGRWQHVIADESGFLWISDGKRLLSMNPRKPEDGWIDASAEPGFPEKNGIRSLKLSPSGSVQPVFRREADLEFLRDNKNTITLRPVQPTPWQQDWELVARLPGGTHDLGGDVLDGNFYMDWAISGEWGYPSKGNFHRHLLRFDPGTLQWEIAADYGQPRGYCAVGALDGTIWTVSGDSKDPAGNRFTTTLSQIYDPETGEMKQGPNLPSALPSALGLSSGGRLYVLGYPAGKGVPLKLYSIDVGETEWTEEPEGPSGQGSLYGTELDGKLYTVMDSGSLAIFDTHTETWETTIVPNRPRSPAVGHFDGEIWVMGGRNPEGEDLTHIYNPQDKGWRKGPDLPRRLSWGCAFTIDGELYVTGGYDYASFNNRTFRLGRTP